MIRLHRTPRRRIAFLLMALLPQMLSLAMMVGMFWMVRLKEVFTAEVFTRADPGHVTLNFRLSPADRPKVEPGSVLHGETTDAAGRALPPFQARVIAIRRIDSPLSASAWEVAAELQPGAGPEAMDPSETLRLSQPFRATLWCRTRRALTVLFTREGRTGTASHATVNRLGLGATP